ncbi:hypothetical protein M3Y99_01565600 [Aphelenchoides fujianensis]|nr:hypothetical protein M3Y99_01565600 [Aphelenchoides fujianensis]
MQPPILGFYLWLMRGRQTDVFAVMYAQHLFDFLMGVSLFVAGFHGSSIATSADDNLRIQPVDCILHAPHLSVWCVLDMASAAVLLLLCVDQVISVVWSKRHKRISGIYLQPGMMFLVFLLSAAILYPSFEHAREVADNKTVTVSAFCSMKDVLDGFYNVELSIRLFAPLAGLGILILAAIALLGYQLAQNWQFKWSDNNEESVSAYTFAVMRASLSALAVHLPVWILRSPRLKPEDEVIIRIVSAVVVSVLQPVGVLWLFPVYFEQIKRIFSKYSHNTKRQWQSADDPPADGEGVGNAEGLDLGSSTRLLGNIVGEAGVPYDPQQYNERQRSVSFYCPTMERY